MRFFRIYVLLSCLLTSWEAQALELLFHVSALPPYVKDDPRQGLVPEIVTRAFATQGIQCKFIRSNNKRMETEVEAGTADAGFAGIPVNNPKIFFSDTVIEFENVAVTLSNKRLQINSLSDLSDKKIVAFSNAQKVLGPEFTMSVKNHRSYSEVGDQASQVPMLDAGRGDVILLDLRAFLYFARLLHGKTEATNRYTVHHLFKPTPRLLGFHKSEHRDHFNKGLKTIRQSGEYAAILNNYRND